MRKTIFKRLEAQGLIANYNRLRKNLPPRLSKKVLICDESLREGVKAPTVFLTYVEKVKLAKMMDEIGVSVINVGFPGLSDDEKDTIRRIANESFQHASLVASARIIKSDVEKCLHCGVREVAIFTAFNGLNLQYRLKMSREQALERTIECIKYAKDHGMKVDFVLEDCSRTPLQEILQIFEVAVNVGADLLVVADTLGFLRPLSTRYLISRIRKGLSEITKKDVPLSIHCHNDFGLATANSLAAVEEGVKYVHTCVSGFGGRAGCAPLEEVCTALELLFNVDTGVDLRKLNRLSQLAEKAFALPIQFHKPIIGENAFTFEEGVLDDTTLGNPLIYEPFPPEIVGRTPVFYIGRQAGTRLVKNRLSKAEIKATPMQIEEISRRMRRTHESLDKGEAQMIFYQIKKLRKDLRKVLTEQEFWDTVEEVTGQKRKARQW